jgi:hypothetical protein
MWDLEFVVHGIEFVAYRIEFVAHGFHKPHICGGVRYQFRSCTTNIFIECTQNP